METRSVYRGANSVSRYYRSWRATYLFVLLLLLGVNIVLYLLYFGRKPPEADFSPWVRNPDSRFLDSLFPIAMFLLMLLYPVGYLIYGFIQEHYYNNVILTDVQKVETRVGTASGRQLFYLTFEVFKDGRRMTVNTQRVFDGSKNKISDYTGRTQMVGYDSKRKHWIVI